MTQPLAKITSMLGSARDLTIEAAVSASARFAETAPTSMGYQEVTKLLNSRNERDILSGMKCVISQISRGECDQDDAIRYFGDVVKNITCNSIQVKNLILIYVTKYAELEPDTALLSINTIQKSLNDKDHNIRAAAIRAMLGIKILSISPIVMLCIKRTVGDLHPDVRSATAIAIGKVFNNEESSKSTKKQLIESLTKLLSDSNPVVVGSALKTYYGIRHSIPQSSHSSRREWDLVHGLFRRFCQILLKLDEWSQSFVIDILVDYCRNFLPKPKIYFSDRVIDYDIDAIGPEHDSEYEVSFDEDLKLFIDSVKPLMYSQSQFVILSISRALLSLAPPKTYLEMKLPLVMVRLIHPTSTNHVQFFTLQAIRAILLIDLTIFSSKYRKFYVFPNDPPLIAQLKLEILSILASKTNISHIFEELKFYVYNSKSSVAKLALVCIGRCSTISETWNQKILKWCLRQIKTTEGSILNELLTVVRYLLQRKQNNQGEGKEETTNLIKTIYRLSLLLLIETNGSSKLESEAKASIIWVIGEFTTVASNMIGPDVLRNLIPKFSQEADVVKYQILVLAAKILTYELSKLRENGDPNELSVFFEDNIHSKLFNHVLQLAKYDHSYDTRDRARMFSVLLSKEHHESQLAALFFEVPKTVPLVKLSEGDVTNDNNTGSVSLDLFQAYSKVADWTDPETHPPVLVRNDTPIHLNGGPNGVVTSISSESFRNSKSGSPADISRTSISSSQFHLTIGKIGAPKDVYKLQSLDEFFGASDEDEEGEEEEEEEDEDEDVEGEEEEEEEEEYSSSEEELSSEESSSDEEDEIEGTNGKVLV